MTLLGISEFLKQHSLRFMGFEIDEQITKAYKKHFPGDQDATNLDKWHIYEQENPDTFVNMYQFWVQKSA